MAMVYSQDVLFLHVPKTGGVSVTRYLLDVLPPPVTYVSPGHLGYAHRAGFVHIPDAPHKSLPIARGFLRQRDIDLTQFPLIMAVVRNPYDLAVSHYSYQRRETLPYTLLDAAEAPAPGPGPGPHRGDPRRRAVAEMLDALVPGKVARIEPTGQEKTRVIRAQLYRTAVERGQQVTAWEHDGVLYAAPVGRDDKRSKTHDLAQRLDFKEFVVNAADPTEPSFLRQVYDFYHLDDRIPPNLRLIRFERLADALREALASVGIVGEAELPWLNRSTHAAYASYYDAESEAAVYEQARWLFDGGFYERLDPAVLTAG